MYTFEIAPFDSFCAHAHDGTKFSTKALVVLATDVKGNRWSHTHVFYTNQCVYDDEGDLVCINDVAHDAQARAEELLKSVRALGSIAGGCWVTADPKPGSIAAE